MTTFIMIVYFKLGYSGGFAFPEFNTLEACNSAIVEIKKQQDIEIALCVPKG